MRLAQTTLNQAFGALPAAGTLISVIYGKSKSGFIFAHAKPADVSDIGISRDIMPRGIHPAPAEKNLHNVFHIKAIS
jgi:hypothetical protein